MKTYIHIKRILDFVFSVLMLIVLSPFMMIIAAAIKLTSKGPVFFKQNRLGKDGRIFIIYKFRTMVDGAASLGGGVFTNDKDFRITKTGHLLRKTSLDEVPQLFNIIMGDMSFIGPRPPVPYHPYTYENYTEEQKKRFTIRPGISGLAQVVYRTNATWNERILKDIEYIDNISFILDTNLFFKTIFNILKGKNVIQQEDTAKKIQDEILKR